MSEQHHLTSTGSGTATACDARRSPPWPRLSGDYDLSTHRCRRRRASTQVRWSVTRFGCAAGTTVAKPARFWPSWWATSTFAGYGKRASSRSMISASHHAVGIHGPGGIGRGAAPGHEKEVFAARPVTAEAVGASRTEGNRRGL